ncbi:DUF1501 domain-containing protein [Catenovulum adriaticum]|uniref:DUF1501 domain-containing protein n=1 Tax=Catenovulum adriaticum TaxID=2984846 RepID=A0ABY7ARU7_9ALTE|nr:DUF1501 domain-containing protein [Catenovulum sp. TS8]WAJ71215.1 DUF1501 domain-containing protein [Catenovulum sp. TS8]
MQRRDFLKATCAGWVLLNTGQVQGSDREKSLTNQNKKIVWIVLRGAMDSLHAVIPSFDSHLKMHRQSLLAPIEANLLPLENGYSLHPAFKNLHQWYQQKQLLPVVAVASSYRSRSHFDGQDILETGLSHVEHDNGWLARATRAINGEGIAIARSIPISMRGYEQSLTWYPSNLPDAEDELYRQLTDLYKMHPEFLNKLETGMQTREALNMQKSKNRNAKFNQLAKSCGQLLASSKNANCAMLDMGGWDTHNNQANRLNNQFKQLDQGLNVLKQTLGEQWRDTVVVVATEFGRTVKVNGTAGTDHGTGSAMFIAGGAIKGGKVLGDWPGLAPNQLYQGRDLSPTSDICSWLGALLHQHWRLNPAQIAQVFPSVRPQTVQLVV